MRDDEERIRTELERNGRENGSSENQSEAPLMIYVSTWGLRKGTAFWHVAHAREKCEEKLWEEE